MQVEDFLLKLIQEVTRDSSWAWNESCLENFFKREGLKKTESDLDRRLDYDSEDGEIDISVYLNELRRLDWLSLAIDAIEEPNTFEAEVYDAHIATLERQFQQTLERLENKLGAAYLSKESCSSEVIEHYCAIQIAIWSFSDFFTILKLEHQDPDVPITLDIIVSTALI